MNSIATANTTLDQNQCFGQYFGAVEKKNETAKPETILNLQPFRFNLTEKDAERDRTGEELKVNRLRAFGRNFAGSLY